ncbi:MAG: hypothetical protein K6T83_20875 [Alicyclobacillus sp.]|nr:hypothetical protein [Alicyclobacillus sp.]
MAEEGQEQRRHTTSAQTRSPLQSTNSGWYDPGPVNETELPNAELSTVQAHVLDLQLEEFPEGPYGAATSEPLGKSTPRRDGQTSVSPFRDQNPMGSDRKVALHEPPDDDPIGTLDGES